MLKDMIYVIQMLPDESMDPSVLWDNLVMLIVRAKVWLVQSRGTNNRRRLWQGVCKGSGDIPSCTASFISSRRPPNIYIIHESCCYVGHLILYDKQNVPLQDLDRICGPHGKGIES